MSVSAKVVSAKHRQPDVPEMRGIIPEEFGVMVVYDSAVSDRDLFAKVDAAVRSTIKALPRGNEVPGDVVAMFTATTYASVLEVVGELRRNRSETEELLAAHRRGGLSIEEKVQLLYNLMRLKSMGQ